ncbi:MAG: (2Fe-2S)-binding protein [Acidobacteria bacterium]|nr:(2Fe-2S)-binding protein [Acidobacteriota bacterium]
MSKITRDGDDKPVNPEADHDSGVSRRSFLKGSGIALSVPLVTGGVRTVKAAGQDVKIHGPNKVSITLDINGKKQAATVEPRVTLLDTLRNELDTTGAKRVCDRGTCGACTVLMDGKPVYACSVLAIEAQGKKIQTVENLELNGKLSPVQQAIVDNDGQQCGFCTPGFTVACTALLNKYPDPTDEQTRLGLGGNLCRCGTYVGLREAVKQVAAQRKGGKR